ncbi:MAG: DUF1080 domain-containing protein [Planctomycetota bacterium]
MYTVISLLALHLAAAPVSSAADPDFAVQGEYLAEAWDAGRLTATHGLQVVARGEGKFEGYLFEGGLPGNGGPPTSRRKLNGHRQDAEILLNDTDWEVRLSAAQATLAARDGSRQTTLRKVQRTSRTLGAAPPPHAVRLFDGTDTGEFQGFKMSDEGLLQVGAETKRSFGDFQLHLEFQLPFMPSAEGQARGNSGVYIQRRYEVQILDSFGLVGEANECGGLYRQQAPELNMCLPPLTWQTYDIHFRAARWDEAGQKTANANISVYLNGVAVHAVREIPTKTGAGQPEGPEPRAILLQNHGDPVQFRNVWIVDGSDGLQSLATATTAAGSAAASHWSDGQPAGERASAGWLVRRFPQLAMRGGQSSPDTYHRPVASHPGKLVRRR